MKFFNRLEQALLMVGIVLLTIYGAARLDEMVSSRAALARFSAIQKAAKNQANPTGSTAAVEAPIDFALWSPERIHAYRDSLDKMTDLPIAVIRVERLAIEVPVFNGTDDLTLNRGAGRIIGTGQPGAGGNIGISAHRDGFFRALKDVRLGDAILLDLADGRTERYIVDVVQIVTPDNVGILRSREVPSVTLVTCYPFYFIGSAPKRFIVQGSLSP